tara:strand:- start:519 stop:3575 length:3057 start_codon:yes stop_codon:yes gene_type:complete
MKRFAATAGLLLFVLSHQALAANAFLMVFLDDAPLSGVRVTLDDVPIGRTDARGSAESTLSAGDHVITLTDDEIEFPVAFSSAADEDVEIQVTFTSAEGDEPRVKINKFGPGDQDAATGYITGQVTDPSGEPIAGASISVVGTQYQQSTDEDGVYVLEVPRGEYDLNVSSLGDASVTLRDIRVLADLGVTATVRLLPAGAADVSAPSSPQLEEVFVLGVFNPQEDSASVERYATSITNAIDVTQLERFGDGDVASALNRAVGVSVVDNKFATVRGLDGRYISSTLNGLLMPSTDPQRRDVQLDLFPTSIVQGIEIQKSYSPDKLATTTGGGIEIITKGIPDEYINEISGSTAVNTDFTFSRIIDYKGSEDEWTTFDSGLRDLPNGILAATDGGRSLTICDPSVDPERCTAPIDAARLGVKFQDDYNVGDKNADPDYDVSWVIGDRLPAGDNEWGYYAAAEYGQSTSDRGEAQLTDPLELEGSYQRSEVATALTGYVSAGYEYGAANEVLAKTLFLRNSEDTTRRESGVDSREGNAEDRTILQWVEREFLSQAFTGHNEFEADSVIHLLDWRAAYSRTTRDEPDRRQYTYLNNSLSTSAFERRWSELEEDSVDFGVDYNLTWNWGDISSTQFLVGALWSDKNRDVDQYRFGITRGIRGNEVDFSIDRDLETEVLPYQNFALDRIRLSARTTDTDSYKSQETVTGAYLSTNTDIGEAWTVVLGARWEDFDQTLEYPNDPLSDSELQYDDIYPALNVAWRMTEEWQLRVGYSETASYPGLIERSTAQSYDPDTDDPIFGNPDLQVSTIDNWDARAEYYFSDTESVSLALFYKDITQPVERAVPDASGSAATRGITFINQDSAELTGVELDANIDLWEGDNFLLFAGGNITYIDSEVTLSEESLRLEGASSQGRQLQGQSEWLGNLQFGFDHYPSEQKFTVLFNYFDDRIFRVARGAATGPEYEDGRLLIDLTYENMWSESFTLEASIKNLLNEQVSYSQNGRSIEEYEVGTLLGVSFKYTF